MSTSSSSTANSGPSRFRGDAASFSPSNPYQYQQNHHQNTHQNQQNQQQYMQQQNLHQQHPHQQHQQQQHQQQLYMQYGTPQYPLMVNYPPYYMPTYQDMYYQPQFVIPPPQQQVPFNPNLPMHLANNGSYTPRPKSNHKRNNYNNPTPNHNPTNNNNPTNTNNTNTNNSNNNGVYPTNNYQPHLNGHVNNSNSNSNLSSQVSSPNGFANVHPSNIDAITPASSRSESSPISQSTTSSSIPPPIPVVSTPTPISASTSLVATPVTPVVLESEQEPKQLPKPKATPNPQPQDSKPIISFPLYINIDEKDKSQFEKNLASSIKQRQELSHQKYNRLERYNLSVNDKLVIITNTLKIIDYNADSTTLHSGRPADPTLIPTPVKRVTFETTPSSTINETSTTTNINTSKEPVSNIPSSTNWASVLQSSAPIVNKKISSKHIRNKSSISNSPGASSSTLINSTPSTPIQSTTNSDNTTNDFNINNESAQPIGILLLRVMFDPNYSIFSSKLPLFNITTKGLTNTGNICYMNSILQILLYCEPFNRLLKLIEDKSIGNLSKVSPTPLLDATIKFFNEFVDNPINSRSNTSTPKPESSSSSSKVEDNSRTNTPNGSNTNSNNNSNSNSSITQPKAISPETFYMNLINHKKFSHLKWGQQEDAEEFMGYYLDGLNEEFVEAIRKLNTPSIDSLIQTYSNSNEGEKVQLFKYNVKTTVNLIKNDKKNKSSSGSPIIKSTSMNNVPSSTITSNAVVGTTTATTVPQNNDNDNEAYEVDNEEDDDDADDEDYTRFNDDNDGWNEVGSNNKSISINKAVEVEPTPINFIFGGQFKSVLTIPKSATSNQFKKSITFDPFQNLQLDISEADSIEDAFNNLNNIEKISFKSKHNKELQIKKQTFIDKLPQVLIIHLKRFSFLKEKEVGIEKLRKRVDYSHDLKIPKGVLSNNIKLGGDEELIYRLTGVVYHHGSSAEGGHYTSDVLKKSCNEWVRIDDTLIKSVSEDEVLGGPEENIKNAYILMYERK